MKKIICLSREERTDPKTGVLQSVVAFDWINSENEFQGPGTEHAYFDTFRNAYDHAHERAKKTGLKVVTAVAGKAVHTSN